MNRRLAGKKATSEGGIFEQNVEYALRFSGHCVIRIPDSCKQVSQVRIIRVFSPFDYIAIKEGRTILFDCKSYELDNLSYSKIDPNQLNHLYGAEQAGIIAGYLVHFRSIEKVVFFHASQLKALTKYKSLKPNDGQNVGSVYSLDFSKIK